MAPKTNFPDGISILVGADQGDAFNCAFRLSELLEGMKVGPISLKVNQITPDLLACKSNCLEIVMGDVAVH